MDDDERDNPRSKGYPPGAVHEEQRRDKESRRFTADPHKAIGGDRGIEESQDSDGEATDRGGETDES